MSVAKLCLGTAGLGGLPYGLGQRAVVRYEAMGVIRAAYDAGIRLFDTAPSYGQAEQWIADALPAGGNHVVMTKTTGDIDQALASLAVLGPQRTNVLWHNWKGEALPLWAGGVSVYSADGRSASGCIVQCDWNLLRQGLTRGKASLFLARSVFLQGNLSGAGAVRPKLQAAVARAARFAEVCGVDLPTLALRAALENPEIDSVLIGPTSTKELDVCLEIAARKPLGVNHLLPMLAIDDPETDPRTWSAA